MRKFFNMIAVYLAAVLMLSTVVGCSYAPRALPKLATPEVTIGSDGIATWNSVDNALYYVYVIDEGDEKLTDECSVRLSDNDSIKVKAVSGSEKYNDSDFSKYKTYIQGTVQPNQPTKLGIPQITVSEGGVVTWNNVVGAQYYMYIINGGNETKTTECTVTLTNNQTIKVKACSDAEDYDNSDYSQLKTYANGSVQTKLTAPQVTVSATGVATWNSIVGAQYYV
ncbi:MAG: hypothetical protein K2O39_02745, partial [Clostridiales bacterium]|nr:hypothetical protein [Clostridiales bacterium]